MRRRHGMGRDGRWLFAAMVMVVVGARDEGLVRGLFGVCWIGGFFFTCVGGTAVTRDGDERCAAMPCAAMQFGLGIGCGCSQRYGTCVLRCASLPCPCFYLF